MKKLKEKIFKLQKRLADGKLVKNPNPKGRKEMGILKLKESLEL